MDLLDSLDSLSIGTNDVQVIKVEPEDLSPALQRVKECLQQNKPILGSKIQELQSILSVDTKEELSNARALCRMANKPIKQIKDMGLETRKPFTQFNKDVITAENEVIKDLEDEINRVKRLADLYEVELAKEAQRIKQEAEVKTAELLSNAKTDRDKLLIYINAQKESQETGSVNVRARLLKAIVSDVSAYIPLLHHYLTTNGDIDKLQFLADYALKNGKPTIPGVKYTYSVD